MLSTALPRRGSAGRRHLRSFLSALIIALLVPFTTVLATPANAVDGSISGVVTSSEGDPLEDVLVAVYALYDGEWYYENDVYTDLDGTYEVVVPQGPYRVGIEDNELYEPAFYNAKTTLETANTITVDGAETGIDLTLTAKPSGVVSGTVTAAADGAPLADVFVSVYIPDEDIDFTYWDYYRSVETDETGDYSITLPVGDYRIGFESDNGNYQSEYFDDVTSVYDGDTVAVLAGQTRTVNASLAPPGKVTGRVTASDTGLALEGISVRAYVNYGDEEFPDWDWEDTTFTDANGDYELIVTGTYRIGFDDSQEGIYAPEFYDNVAFVTEADDVSVSMGDVTADIDAALIRSGHITGKVVNTSATALPGVYVEVYRNAGTLGDPDWQYVTGESTDINGNYDARVGAGTYRVGFFGDLGEVYYNAQTTLDDANDVTVVGTGTVPNINATLDEPPQPASLEYVSDPIITGIAKVGSPLTVSNGVWSPAATSHNYAWFRDGERIDGANSATYLPTPADVDTYLYAVVTANRSGYYSEDGYSDEIGPIANAAANTGLPRIIGNALVGSTLTASPGVWVPSGATFSYQWLASGVAIPGARAVTFKPTATQLGKRLSVRVTATKVGIESGVATSAATAGVKVQPAMTLSKKVKKTTVTLTIRVAAPGVSAITGKVKVYRKSKLLKTVNLANGSVKVKLKKQPKGKAKYRAVYLGSSTALTVTKSIKVKV